MPDPTALDERARQLRWLADEVDDCADPAVRRAASPHWVSPHAEDVRAELRQAQTRARTAATELRAAAYEAERSASQEREEREADRQQQVRLEQARAATP